MPKMPKTLAAAFWRCLGSAIDIMFLPIGLGGSPATALSRRARGTIGERNASVYIRPMSGRFTSIKRLSCSLVGSWLFLLAVHAPTHAQTVAVFDFELIDTSLEGEIRGARSDEQARLGQLSLQLRERLKDFGPVLARRHRTGRSGGAGEQPARLRRL